MEIQNQHTKASVSLSANEAPCKKEITKAILSTTASQRIKYLGISFTEEVKDVKRKP